FFNNPGFYCLSFPNVFIGNPFPQAIHQVLCNLETQGIYFLRHRNKEANPPPPIDFHGMPH
ncbi:MAG: hypothetical protein AB7I96_13355, partial [Candidatus Dadabacteria bacterium]